LSINLLNELYFIFTLAPAYFTRCHKKNNISENIIKLIYKGYLTFYYYFLLILLVIYNDRLFKIIDSKIYIYIAIQVKQLYVIAKIDAMG